MDDEDDKIKDLGFLNKESKGNKFWGFIVLTLSFVCLLAFIAASLHGW